MEILQLELRVYNAHCDLTAITRHNNRTRFIITTRAESFHCFRAIRVAISGESEQACQKYQTNAETNRIKGGLICVI